jgi:hypothetical protein
MIETGATEDAYGATLAPRRIHFNGPSRLLAYQLSGTLDSVNRKLTPGRMSGQASSSMGEVSAA